MARTICVYGYGLVAMHVNGALVYKGEMCDFKRNGLGTEYDMDGNVVYRGNWRNDVYDGHGTLFSKDGRICRRGEWKNGKRQTHPSVDEVSAKRVRITGPEE